MSGFAPNETVERIAVTLHDLSHEPPDDINVLLVGPEGQNVVLLSNAGGGFVDPAAAVTLTYANEAGETQPDEGPFVSGTFKPTNYEQDEEEDDLDVFPDEIDEGPPPHPEPSSATALSVFAGTHPNGDWRLFVVDDDVFDAGSIASGWSLTIWTVTQSAPFRRGDANANGVVNLSNAVLSLNHLFLSGEAPACADAADTDDNGSASLTDAIYTLNYLFRGGPTPEAPGPDSCGTDPTEDELACDSQPGCGQCPQGLPYCDGTCTNLAFDTQNCGACGVVCPPGTTCSGGLCQPTEPSWDCGF